MDAGGAPALSGEAELKEENFSLSVDVVIFYPAIKANFADGGRHLIEVGDENGLPVSGAFGDVPWMVSEGREDGGRKTGKGEDVGPVGFGGAVDDHFVDRRGGDGQKDGGEMGFEAVVLEVVVGVVEHERLIPN